jgi:hypothetical protein
MRDAPSRRLPLDEPRDFPPTHPSGLSQCARRGTFVQAAGLTSTLVLANSALLIGDKRVKGSLAVVVIVALIIASLALVAAGLYGLAALMRTFDRVAPHNTTRVLERSRNEEANRKLVAALLAAHRRTSLVADWKLARFKRATIAFRNYFRNCRRERSTRR